MINWFNIKWFLDEIDNNNKIKKKEEWNSYILNSIHWLI